MTYDDIINALGELLWRVNSGVPVDALTLDRAREALRLLNEVGFQ